MFYPNYAFHPNANRDALLGGLCPLPRQVTQRFLLNFPYILLLRKNITDFAEDGRRVID